MRDAALPHRIFFRWGWPHVERKGPAAVAEEAAVGAVTARLGWRERLGWRVRWQQRRPAGWGKGSSGGSGCARRERQLRPCVEEGVAAAAALGVEEGSGGRLHHG